MTTFVIFLIVSSICLSIGYFGLLYNYQNQIKSKKQTITQSDEQKYCFSDSDNLSQKEESRQDKVEIPDDIPYSGIRTFLLSDTGTSSVVSGFVVPPYLQTKEFSEFNFRPIHNSWPNWGQYEDKDGYVEFDGKMIKIIKIKDPTEIVMTHSLPITLSKG